MSIAGILNTLAFARRRRSGAGTQAARRPGRGTRHWSRPVLEMLEDRRLLSISFDPGSGTLTLTDDGGPAFVHVGAYDGSTIDAAVFPSRGGGTEQQFAGNQVRTVNILVSHGSSVDVEGVPGGAPVNVFGDSSTNVTVGDNYYPGYERPEAVHVGGAGTLFVNDIEGCTVASRLVSFNPFGANSADGDVTFAAVGKLVVESVGAEQPVTVQAIDQPTDVVTTSPNITIGDNGSVAGIHGTVNITPNDPWGNTWPDSTTVNVDDSADTTPQTVTLDDSNSVGSISFSGLPGVIRFADANTRQVNLTTGTGGDTVNVLRTGVPVTLSAGGWWGALDTVNVGHDGTVQDIKGALTVTNPPSYTTLNVLDAADGLWHNSVSVTDQAIQGLAPAPIYYHAADLAALNIFGGANVDTYNVLNTPGNFYGVTTSLYTNDGGTIVNVTGTTGPLQVIGSVLGDVVNIGQGSLAGINGAVTVTNPPSYTSLYINDSGDTTAHTSVSLTAEGLTGLARAGIYWSASDLEALNIRGGPGADVFHVTGTPVNEDVSTTLTTGGNSTVDVAATQGPLTLVGQGNNEVVNLGDSTGVQHIYGAVTVTNPPSYTTLNIDDTPDPLARHVTLTSNSLMGLALAPIYFQQADLAALTISGGSGGNTFTVGPVPYNQGMVTRLNTGAGNDTVRIVAPTSGLQINGQGGVNTLDYSGYAGDVTVDLALGMATGASGGVSNFQTVIGGQGNSLLVGGISAPVTLIGGAGRNLLIGGSGPATLIGGGGGDNLLIGGTTYWDTILPVLDELFAEWTRTDGLQQRMYNLRNGGGRNGQYVLNTTTVQTANAHDALSGGTGFDWFWAGPSDTISNRHSGDVTN
jgi:hypothetical protein